MANAMVLFVPTLATVAENAVLPLVPSPHPPFQTVSITLLSVGDSQVPEVERGVSSEPTAEIVGSVAVYLRTRTQSTIVITASVIHHSRKSLAYYQQVDLPSW